MVDEKEPQVDVEPKRKGKLISVVIGVVLVVAAAAGVVAVTAPPGGAPVPEKVDLDKLPAQRWPKQLLWTFNLNGQGLKAMGKLEVSFDYKCSDAAAAQQAITRAWDKAVDNGRILLLGKTRSDLASVAGVVQLKAELQEIMNTAFFPDGKGKVADVYILEMISQ